MNNIILVGFMGTGKSVVGKKLAAKLNRDFVELDDIVETREKMPIKDIFEKKGELYFRLVEKKIVKEASQLKNKVISAGGGAIVDEENFKNLKNSGTIICLKASPETILKRTKGLKTRPLLNVHDTKKQIEELLKKRETYYNKADFSIETDNISIDEIVLKIIAFIA
nr:shikimate kinase [Candidatus Omnitrophota bacterium]